MSAPAAPSFRAVAAGHGGIEDLRKHINEATVQYALLKFVFGTGAFARTKILFLHINGDKCSALKRGRLNTKKGAAKEFAGAVAAEVIISEAGECSVDFIMEHLSKIIASDKSGAFSIASMKADYEAMLKAAAAGAAFKPRGGRRTAAEMGYVPTHVALEELRKPLGAFNWCLFRGKTPAGELDFVNAGSMSIDEMRNWLKPDEVRFGVLRMGFGTGRFRRIKFIFIHWSGDAVGAVARGRANSQKREMCSALAPYSVELTATTLDEFTIEAVLDKVRRAARIDGEGVESKDGDPLSLESFMAALKEEQEANAAFFGDEGGEDGAAPAVDLGRSLEAIHKHDDITNWLLFESAE